METEAPITILPTNSLKAAPFTSKLLGNSHLNIRKFSPYVDFNQSATNFENFEHIEHFTAALSGDGNGCGGGVGNEKSRQDKSFSSFTKMLNGKIEELKQKRAMDSGGGNGQTKQSAHKTAKFAMIFKLKKEEVKQMQNGDTTILKSFFKNMSCESVLKPENFEIMSEQNLQTIIENIRQAASVVQVEGTRKLELPLGVWSTTTYDRTKNGSNAVRKQHMSSTSRHTQCEYAAVDSGFQNKPLKALMQQHNYQFSNNKATQYETGMGKKISAEILRHKQHFNKAIQCELLMPLSTNSNDTSNKINCKSKSAVKLVEHKAIQSDELPTQLSEASVRLLQQDMFYSKQIGEELSRSLHESQDSLEITRKKFSKKQDEPQFQLSLKEAGREVQANNNNRNNDFESPSDEWCEAIDDNECGRVNDNDEYVVTDDSDSVDNDDVVKAVRSIQSSLQFDDTVFAFLDEIYSDLSLSEEDDFRSELKAEMQNLQKCMRRKTNGKSKIPKPCIKKCDEIQNQLALFSQGSEDSMTCSENSNASNETRATFDDENSSKQSKIPVLVTRKPNINPTTRQHKISRQIAKMSNRSPKPCKFKTKNSLMRPEMSTISLVADSAQRNSLTYIERQRQLIEIIVKGVEQELKSYD